MKTGIGFRKAEIGWARCWASECPETAVRLLEFPRQDSFRFIWYCEQHCKQQRKQHPTSRVRRALIHDGNGKLFAVMQQPLPKIKKEET